MDLAGPQETKAFELRLLDKKMTARVPQLTADWPECKSISRSKRA